jgi:hypothetical protein
MKKANQTIKVILGISVALVSTIAVNVTPAMAVIQDSQMAFRIDSSRKFLQMKEQKLMKDIDDLNWELHHGDANNDPNNTYDLQRRIDQKYRDLNIVRLDIKELSRIL